MRDAPVAKVQTEEVGVLGWELTEAVDDSATLSWRCCASRQVPSQPIANGRARQTELPCDRTCRSARCGEGLSCRYFRPGVHRQLDAAERIRTSTPVRARRPERRVYTSFTTA